MFPVIADAYVDREFGTGVVKVTPAHDVNDYAVGQRHHLPMIGVLSLDATLNDQAPEAYRGLDRFEARKKVIAAFEELGLTWHWDAGIWSRLPGRGREAVRAYVETEQAHLLRAYDADFLVEAVESAKARCQAVNDDPRHPGRARHAAQERLAA